MANKSIFYPRVDLNLPPITYQLPANLLPITHQSRVHNGFLTGSYAIFTM